MHTVCQAMVVAVLVLGPLILGSHDQRSMVSSAAATAPDPVIRASVRPDPRPSAVDGPRLDGYWEIIAKKLQLTAEQRTQLLAVVEERKAARSAWHARHEETLSRLEGEESAAQAAGDREALARVRTARHDIVAMLTPIEERCKAGLNAILTPGQRQKLAAYRMWTGMLVSYRELKLTDEQKAQIERLCDAAAAERFKDLKGEPEPRDVESVRKKLAPLVEREVLTNAQREMLARASQVSTQAHDPARNAPAPAIAPAPAGHR